MLNKELSHHLTNRHFHARITTFRPFLQAIVLCDAVRSDSPSYATVLDGALECVIACIEFLEAQSSPQRHFGSWRCGRGIWAAGLSVLAAVSIPALRSAIKGMPPTPGVTYAIEDEGATGQLLDRAKTALGVAAGWLSEWEEESSSLRLGASTLWTGLKEAGGKGLFT